MTQTLAHVALIVRDYDEALAFYVGKLGFALVEDRPLPEQRKRWVTIRPPGAGADATTILLAHAATPEQERFIGDQAGGRVFLFLATDAFDRDHAAFTAAGVRFLEDPRSEAYGKVAVFEDPYGNRWDLIEHSAPAAPPRPNALSAPQVARAGVGAGKFSAEAEARATPLGLLAVSGIVATFLSLMPPIIRAMRRRP